MNAWKKVRQHLRTVLRLRGQAVAEKDLVRRSTLVDRLKRLQSPPPPWIDKWRSPSRQWTRWQLRKLGDRNVQQHCLPQTKDNPEAPMPRCERRKLARAWAAATWRDMAPAGKRGR